MSKSEIDKRFEEKREYPRIEANAYLDCNTTNEQVLLFHSIENISLGGVSVRAPIVEEKGSIVQMALNFPEEGTNIEIMGEVVWVRIEDEGKMGIKFINMPGETKEKLKILLAKINSFYAAL